MNIVALKLVTGEDVLGELVNSQENTNSFKLKNPVGISIIRGQNGQPSVGFSPFPLHAEQKIDSTIDFQSSHVVYSYTPAEDFISNYNQIFGSGIVTPTKKLVLG